MRFAALALVFVAAASYCEAETREELIQMADEARAPFTTVALERMNNADLWGVKRGKSSVDIVIINASGKSLESGTPACEFGSLVSTGLEPEENLDGHSSTVLGVQSSDYSEHAYVDCALTYYYGEDRSTRFDIHVVPENVRGGIHVKTDSSPDIKVSESTRKGESTQIIIKVEDSSE